MPPRPLSNVTCMQTAKRSSGSPPARLQRSTLAGLRRQVNAPVGVFASKHALAECVPNASVMKAAAAEVAHVAGPRCRLPGCSCRCCRARGTLGRRTPGCRRAPQAPVKWWVETLSPLRSKSHAPVGPWPLARITLGLRGPSASAPSAHSGKLSKGRGKAGSVPPGRSARRK